MKVEDLKNYGIESNIGDRLLIVFCSKWCKSCELLSSIVEKIIDESFIRVIEVEIGENSRLAKDLNIHAVPAFAFFNNGKLLDKKITLYGDIIVNKGILIGHFNETLLKEIIKEIYPS